MQVTISGHHVEVTDALRQYIQDKFKRMSCLTGQVVHANFTLSVEKLVRKADVTLQIAHSNDIHLAFESPDMYASVDGLLDMIDRQLVEFKQRNVDAKRQVVRPVY